MAELAARIAAMELYNSVLRTNLEPSLPMVTLSETASQAPIECRVATQSAHRCQRCQQFSDSAAN
jgi:hypothetical protein